MKHKVYALLLCMSFSLCANSDNHIADKSKRIGRFSYEDSFDESLVENILKHAPSAVKKNIKRLLYPSDNEDIPQRLLLLGGTSNATTTAIAKTIAVRCGYEYYVIDAAALLREYREGRQMLLSEVRPIIKSGKPIALIITELPEMADYSGLLASTLWLLIDQAAQYQDVLVIATSAFEKGQLSEDVKERFGENIVPVVLNKDMQEHIESVVVPKSSWLERNKVACIVISGFTLISVFACLQFYLINLLEQQREENEKRLVEIKSDFDEEKASLEKGLHNTEQRRMALELQQKGLELQQEGLEREGKEVEQERKALENMKSALEKERAFLEQSKVEFNQKVDDLNQHIDGYNQNIQTTRNKIILSALLRVPLV